MKSILEQQWEYERDDEHARTERRLAKAKERIDISAAAYKKLMDEKKEIEDCLWNVRAQRNRALTKAKELSSGIEHENQRLRDVIDERDAEIRGRIQSSREDSNTIGNQTAEIRKLNGFIMEKNKLIMAKNKVINQYHIELKAARKETPNTDETKPLTSEEIDDIRLVLNEYSAIKETIECSYGNIEKIAKWINSPKTFTIER
jgi:uncharacterized phage infection (PIP) family protein YhgE